MMALTVRPSGMPAAVLVDQLAEGGAQRQLVVARACCTLPDRQKIFTPGLFSVPKRLVPGRAFFEDRAAGWSAFPRC